MSSKSKSLKGTENTPTPELVPIPKEVYDTLVYLGIINSEDETRTYHVGNSDYSERVIQPWTIWQAYPQLTPWDCDIVKRVLRTKVEFGMSKEDSRVMDYKKIIHNCKERIRQIETLKTLNNDNH